GDPRRAGPGDGADPGGRRPRLQQAAGTGLPLVDPERVGVAGGPRGVAEESAGVRAPDRRRVTVAFERAERLSSVRRVWRVCSGRGGRVAGDSNVPWWWRSARCRTVGARPP